MPNEWIISGLASTWESIGEVLRDRDERTFDALTPCPGWSIRDVVNHLAGAESFLDGATVPEVTGAPPSYVRNAQGAQNEAFVASGRHLSGRATMENFSRTTKRRLQSLAALSEAEWHRSVPTPDGERTLAQVTEARIVEAWIHLQDIRDALLEPADDHGPGEEVVLNHCEATLPYAWAVRAAAPEGATLQMHISGRSARTVLIRVVQGRGVPISVVESTATVTVSVAAALFWRRCAGRIHEEAFLRASSTDIQGDKELARRLAASMAFIR